MKAAPFPRGGGFKSSLWDCKVTPAYCTCQERNTIGCISSNGGLGAGEVELLSTRAIHGAFTNVGEGSERGGFSELRSEWGWKSGGWRGDGVGGGRISDARACA